MDRKLATPSEAMTFYFGVFPEELRIIHVRREARNLDTASLYLEGDGDQQRLPRCERGLTGLALSGGGIRSATFNLGVLQGMAKIRNEKTDKTLFPLFDYLSTVSGGGYIGSWLSDWIRNEGSLNVEKELSGKPREQICETNESPEPSQIQHLRDYSNYLSPRLGPFSPDTWSLIATYLRNTFLIQLVFIPLLAALLLLPRLVAEWTDACPAKCQAAAAVPAFVLTALAIWCASYAAGRQSIPFSRRMLHWLVIIPLVLAAGWLLWLPFDTPSTWRSVAGWALVFITLNLVAWALYWPDRKSRGAQLRPPLWAVFAWWAAALVGGLIAGFLFGAVFVGFGARYWSNAPWHLATWGPPFALLLFVTAFNIQLGIRGKYESDMSLEWWASMTGWLLAYAAGWWALAAISIYGPLLVKLLFDLIKDWAIAQYSVVVGWLLTALGAILAGRSPRSGELHLTTWMDYAAKTLTPIAVIGIMIAIAIGLNAVPYLRLDSGLPTGNACTEQAAGMATTTMFIERYADTGRQTVDVRFGEGTKESASCGITREYWQRLTKPTPGELALLLGFCLLVGLGMGIAVDVNEFSMHAFYRNRLVRCYLRAVRKKGAETKPNPVSDLDTHDDLLLADLADPVIGQQNGRPAPGPYLLINTTLNLTDPDRLAWQERKAAPFILAPLYSGSNITGYRKTRDYADDIKLGTALAISGASYTSNMGYHTNRALAFFLSMFNVRLGWWVGHPGRKDYNRQGPRVGLLYLLVELLGRANEHRKYVYLSDGGHFDNLGLYELVRRRCRYIVCSDAGEDSDYTFDDLGMAIRKIRADFGVDIEINLDMVKPQDGQRFSRWHHAIGTIRYDKVDKDSPVGMLVYIKTSLVGDEPADVLEYKANHPDFPHETTLDQWFSESQFEAYRSLGEHIAQEVFRHAQHGLK